MSWHTQQYDMSKVMIKSFKCRNFQKLFTFIFLNVGLSENLKSYDSCIDIPRMHYIYTKQLNQIT